MNDDATRSRLEEFQAEVDEMRISGGRTNPERTAIVLSVLLFAAAIVVEIVAFSQSSSAEDPRDQTDMVILALLGVVLALGAVAVFVRVSLTRWFRYWLVRLIYENRAQTDALRDAIEDPTEGD